MVLAEAATAEQGALIPRQQSSVTSFPLAIGTISEHYWAARAYVAETLLSATITHHEQMEQLRISEGDKRTSEIYAVHKFHESRYGKLETVMAFLLAFICALVSFLGYILLGADTVKTPTSKWNPLHFTIPILSPFTSVIEHDASAFTTGKLTVIGIILASLAYFSLRYWVSRRS